MSSSAITTQIAQLKVSNIQNQADSTSIYSNGQWSFKNSTALTSVTITDAGAVTMGPSNASSITHFINGAVLELKKSTSLAVGDVISEIRFRGEASTNRYASIRGIIPAGSPGVDFEGLQFTTCNANSQVTAMTIDASGNLLGSGKTSVDFTATGWQLTALGALNGIVNGNADACATYNKTTNTGQVLYAGYSNIGSTLSQKFLVFADGNVRIAAGSTYGNFSDIKFKENIVHATPKLEDVLKLQVRNFTIKNEGLKAIGFIAQEFEQVFPALVVTSPDKDMEGNELGTESKAIKESALIPILVKAIQELSAKVDAQAEEIKALKAQP